MLKNLSLNDPFRSLTVEKMIGTAVIIVTLVSTINADLASVHVAGRCARAAKSCLLTPEATEGPYYWNTTVRKDITFVFFAHFLMISECQDHQYLLFGSFLVKGKTEFRFA